MSLSSTTSHTSSYVFEAQKLKPAVAGNSQITFRTSGPPLTCSNPDTHVQPVVYWSHEGSCIEEGMLVARRHDRRRHEQLKYLYTIYPPFTFGQQPHVLWVDPQGYSCSLQDKVMTLAEYSKQGNIKTTVQVRDILKQLATSVNCLHQLGFLHRDIQASNIMQISKAAKDRFALGDLWSVVPLDKRNGAPPEGLAHVDYPPELMGEVAEMFKLTGHGNFAKFLTKNWIEQRTKSGSHPFSKEPTPRTSTKTKLRYKHITWTKAVDIYALGHVMWKIMQENKLWNPKKIPKTCALIERMLQKDPKLRPTAKMVLADLKKIDMNYLFLRNYRLLNPPTPRRKALII